MDSNQPDDKTFIWCGQFSAQSNIMKRVRLLGISCTELPEGTRISYEFEIAGTVHDVWFHFSMPAANAAIEAFLAFTLLPAMKAGADLAIDMPMSRQMLGNVETIEDIFACWQPDTFRHVAIQAQPTCLATQTSAEVACFFSCGVDSFFTLLKHRDEITTLLLVHGFDISLESTALSAKVSAAVRDVAARLNKKVIEIETNIRAFSDLHLGWDIYHGSALAAVALMLPPDFSKIYVPASHTYSDLMPWGSHPLVDPLWGTEQLQIIHDGCEATRVEKVAALSKSDVAMTTLRVCWRNPQGAYNCGRCDKCLRTMVNLYLAGALGRCTTLPGALNLHEVACAPIQGSSSRAFAEENLRALRACNADPKVIKAIESALSGRDARGVWRVQKKISSWLRKRIMRQPAT